MIACVPIVRSVRYAHGPLPERVQFTLRYAIVLARTMGYTCTPFCTWCNVVYLSIELRRRMPRVPV